MDRLEAVRWTGWTAAAQKHELDAWLRFCFDTLVRACPHDVRIVSYLAMHVEEKNQKRLRDDLEQVKQQLISDQFRAFLLPALPRAITASWSSF